MGTLRPLLTRWTRQDRLALVVVVLAVAFLTGTTVVLTAASAESTGLAGQFSPDAVVAETAGPTQSDASFGLLTASGEADQTYTSIGNAPEPPLPRLDATRRVLLESPTTGIRTVTMPGRTLPTHLILTTEQATRTLPVTEVEARTVFPPHWLRVNETVLGTLGDPTQIALYPDPKEPIPTQGSPLPSVLPFLLAGTNQIQAILVLTSVGAAVLVGVTLFSVTRTTIRERSHTLGVLRTTGATPTKIAGVVLARVLALTGVGLLVGYALGVIGPNFVVNASVYAGLPVTLTTTVTPAVIAVLVPTYAIVLATAAVAALLAAWPALRSPPAQLLGDKTTGPITSQSRSGSRLPTWLTPTLLDPRTIVPATAILAALVAFLLVLLAVGGAVAPLTGEGATITEPGATHPVASSVPEGYADVLGSAGIPASPELLLFSVRDGEPFLTRGANFSAFRSVREVHLTEGHKPSERGQAVIGEDLARGLDLERGDTILLGGSTAVAATRVQIVGVYSGPGLVDDQLVVPLATGWHLSSKPRGAVQYIRTAGALPEETDTDRPLVVHVEQPSQVLAGESVVIEVTLANPTETQQTRELTASLGFSRTTRTVTLPAFSQRTLTLELQAPPPGKATLVVDGRERKITVVDPAALGLGGLPDTVPVGSEPQLTVNTAAGEAVANATISVGDRTYRTGPDGTVRVEFSETGTHTLTVTANDRRLTCEISVQANASRELLTTLAVTPSDPTVLTPLQARLTVRNPWADSLTRTFTLSTRRGTHRLEVTVPPGERVTRSVALGRFDVGEFTVSLQRDDRTVSETSVTITGDDRLASALATQGRTGAGSTLGQAAAALLGNVWVVAAILLVLAAALGIGSSTAVFARAVAARRHTIGVHRATGASPRRVLGIVLADALRLGVPATVLAILLGTGAVLALGEAGQLVAFGIRLSPGLDPLSLLGIAAIALGILLVGAGIAAIRLVRQPPTDLLGRSDASQEPTPEGGRP